LRHHTCALCAHGKLIYAQAEHKDARAQSEKCEFLAGCGAKDAVNEIFFQLLSRHSALTPDTD